MSYTRLNLQNMIFKEFKWVKVKHSCCCSPSFTVNTLHRAAFRFVHLWIPLQPLKYSCQSITWSCSAEGAAGEQIQGTDCVLMLDKNTSMEVLCLSYLYGNQLCCKNIVILNTAHFVTADYMDLSAREAFPIVFPSDCNQQILRQVCAHTHTQRHIHTHTRF